MVVYEDDPPRVGHVERSRENLARSRQNLIDTPDPNFVVAEQTTLMIEQEHAEVLTSVIGNQT